MSQTQKQTAPVVRPVANPVARKRILAADDDPIMREMMMARLGDDVDVICAENGEVAWEKLVAEDFDLAIIDLGMPKLDGFGLIRYLRQTPKTVDLPIIIVTSRGDSEAIEKAFASGASGFVTKPVNWSLFKYSVQFTLKNGQIEKQLRASKAANDLDIRTRDALMDIMAWQLDQTAPDVATISQQVKLKDVVGLSRLLMGKSSVSFAHHDVNDIIESAIQQSQIAASEKSIHLIGRRSLANISIGVDKAIWTDALKRLILIAIESSPAGGTVEIMLGGQRDQSLVISVRDNGPAKSQADIDARMNILVNKNPRQQTDVALPDLNLPIVKTSVQIHGGRVLFQQKIGEGNVAALWLPTSRVHIEQLENTA